MSLSLQKSEIKINVQKVLPLKYRIKNAGNHLYNYGLSPHRVDHSLSEETKYHRNLRKLYMIIYIFFIIKCVMCILIPNTPDNQLTLMLIGDIFVILEIRIHTHIAVLSATLLCLYGQIYHHYIKSLPWLKPFAMMKGLIKPIDLGLNNSDDVIKLLKRYANNCNNHNYLDIILKMSCCQLDCTIIIKE